jgi:predicted proteasome-type protease
MGFNSAFKGLNVFTRNGTKMLLVPSGGLTVVTDVLQLDGKKEQY